MLRAGRRLRVSGPGPAISVVPRRGMLGGQKRRVESTGMERPKTTTLRIGEWCVNPRSGQISRDGQVARVEVRTMRLLVCLAEHAGDVVSIDDLLGQVWPDVTVAPDSVYQAVASLRRLLGDDPKQPAYIETIPRLGYRMVAPVGPWPDPSIEPAGSSRASNGEPELPPSEVPTTGLRPVAALAFAAVAMICIALVSALVFRDKLAKSKNGGSSAIASQAPKSIAVLPFLDLTEGMTHEEFADGMTEELIDKLSKVPGLRVPPPTSSFYFKGQLWPRSQGTPHTTVADIAKALGVAYVLDGSVRKSGSRLRVDARLIRADSGYIVWSETYDRPFDDILMVQDDIAGEVTKALRASIEARPDQEPVSASTCIDQESDWPVPAACNLADLSDLRGIPQVAPGAVVLAGSLPVAHVPRLLEDDGFFVVEKDSIFNVPTNSAG
jgi:transcriptional activator of cad operon